MNVTIIDNYRSGANAVLLPNFRIQKFAIVGSGAIVTKDVAPYSIVVGTPAKKNGDTREANDWQPF